MGAPVVHFEISTRNPDTVRHFYRTLFDWKIDVMEEVSYGVVDTGNGEKPNQINGGIGGLADEHQPNNVTFYIEVEDPDSYLAKVEAAGGKTVMPTTEVPGVVTFATFSDPDGNIVGLVKSTT